MKILIGNLIFFAEAILIIEQSSEVWLMFVD